MAASIRLLYPIGLIFGFMYNFIPLGYNISEIT